MALLSAGACGASDDSPAAAAQTATPVVTATPTTAATTLAPTTTAPPTTAPPTSGATTTTLLTLPQPAAPLDPRYPEPAFEIGTIEIPKIGVQRSLWEGVTLTTLDRGPGHWPGTAMPGQVGNVVVGGHRVSHDHPFRHIDELVPGDEIVMTSMGIRNVYTVTGSQVVTPEDIWVIDQSPAKTATLFACHPPGSVSLRYVVFATLAGT
jgi:sortase A